jgi:serine/threonine protein kinase
MTTDSLTCPSCLSFNATTASHCSTCGQALTLEALGRVEKPVSAPPEPATIALEPGMSLQNGAYTILEVLGQGGFGITYKASSVRGIVAIKESFPYDITARLPGGRVASRDRPAFERLLVRFQHEAETLELLKHPSATQFLEFFHENGTAYLVMEFLRGETLEARLENDEPMRLMEARRVLFTVLEVLSELHRLGLLHRDIKPANLIFTSSGVELIDYGSAVKYRLRERIKRERLLTPMYAPLEQFGESVALSPATDFYALGATLYHALTKREPPSALDRAMGTSFEPRATLPTGDAVLTEMIARCLEMRMEDRPQSAGELLELLRNGSNTGAHPNVKPASATWLETLDSRQRGVIALAIVMFILICMSGLLTLWQLRG